jgi:hypothetical protein
MVSSPTLDNSTSALRTLSDVFDVDDVFDAFEIWGTLVAAVALP